MTATFVNQIFPKSLRSAAPPLSVLDVQIGKVACIYILVNITKQHGSVVNMKASG